VASGLAASLVSLGACTARQSATGTLVVAISDHEEAIDRFESLPLSLESLEVHVAGGQWLPLELSERRVDLTHVLGGKSQQVASQSVPAGRFDALRLDGQAADSVLKEGGSASLTLSQKEAATSFAVEANGTTSIVVDLVVLDVSEHAGPGAYQIDIRQVSQAGTSGAPDGQSPAARAPIDIVIATTDIAVGTDRFAFALAGPERELIANAEVSVTFFDVSGQDEIAKGEPVNAPFFGQGLEELDTSGLYVVTREFDKAGTWGVQVDARLPDGQRASKRVWFEVKSDAAAPAMGEQAPATKNRTLTDEPDLAQLTSDPNPDRDFYSLSVAEAIESGRPTVVVFATPAFCQTRICGPTLDLVKQVKQRFTADVNFVHIEVFNPGGPTAGVVKAMYEWGLTTEPWVFVLDRQGRVVARMEAGTTPPELEPILEELTGRRSG
jgi:hypothetical protein